MLFICQVNSHCTNMSTWISSSFHFWLALNSYKYKLTERPHTSPPACFWSSDVHIISATHNDTKHSPTSINYMLKPRNWCFKATWLTRGYMLAAEGAATWKTGCRPDAAATAWACMFFMARFCLPVCRSCSCRCAGGCRYLHGGLVRWHFPCNHQQPPQQISR